MAQQYQQRQTRDGNGRLKLVIFDMDGTVIDTSGDLIISANESRNMLGLPPLAEELITSCVGDALFQLVEKLFYDAPDRIQEAIPVFQQCYRRHVLGNTAPYPGIHDVFLALREAGIRTGVLSNKPAELVRIPLYHFNLSGTMDFIYGGDAFRERKPSPKPIQRILIHFHVAPEHAVMIGDAPSDVVAGIQAGTHTIAVSYGYADESELRSVKPEAIVHEPLELLPVLEKLHDFPIPEKRSF